MAIEDAGQNEEMPQEPDLIYIWNWFTSLNDWREQGWGIGPLSHQEIESWARLMRLEIFPSEVDAMRRLDRAMREFNYKKDHPDPAPISEQLQAVKQMRDELKQREKPKRGR